MSAFVARLDEMLGLSAIVAKGFAVAMSFMAVFVFRRRVVFAVRAAAVGLERTRIRS